MNVVTLRKHLERLDSALLETARLCIYGSAAVMLIGEDDRFSLDIDVAGPYSQVSERDLAAAGQQIGLPVNPPDDFPGDHIEWIGSARLCLVSPANSSEIVLWQGSRLTVFTVPPADLIASKLIRYDPTDQVDIQFLMIQARARFDDVAQAVERLPGPFRDDLLVRDNLENLRRDVERWVP